MASDYTEEQRYIDSEYPANLAAKLRAADISSGDDLPAWAVEELMQNLLDYAPSFAPGNTLADRNPFAYSVFRAAMDEAKAVNVSADAAWNDRNRESELASRCAHAAMMAVDEVLGDYRYNIVKTYVNAVRKGAA
ncbi:Uncharacterised protein [Mycobacteroides abscessus subsp. abscessus]|uniref:hypothetical protein n=1 Tax=Mycobacteroides abscessus TaxID=36809 RepID=UPI0009263DAB|nr:hypothetical protein [Mycobacteroides abscessus]MDM2175290.1 hypothetical protein [Mycobacteroides abscessus]MDM2176324.1 hypothetical protein [Mycobacteroides abscessus]MDM2204889.1 hypothetical protein [Mycobacteroides abscessus]MDM2210474.1 hypothetical protein [Mycobacteroides abscessus]MDM2215808.1 hypothetical protein [Mycobacteroides abscessus]